MVNPSISTHSRTILREVVTSVISEYKAAEKPDYGDYGTLLSSPSTAPTVSK